MSKKPPEPVEMVGAPGGARRLDLPQGAVILQRCCSACHAQGDHFSVEVRRGGRIYEAITCCACRFTREYITG